MTPAEARERALLEVALLGPIAELVGEASMCWSPQPSTQVFETNEAMAAATRAASVLAGVARKQLRVEELGAELEQERFLHAACLSIAEGAPGWETAIEGERPAQVAVRELRRSFERLSAENTHLRRRVCELEGLLAPVPVREAGSPS